MSIRLHHIIFLLCIGLLSCEKDIDITDQLSFTPKLVLNGQNESDSLIRLHLNQSISTSEDIEDGNISGTVRVLLKQNNQIVFVDDVIMSNGVIDLPYKSRNGYVYEVQLNKSGLPSIVAKDSVPFLKPNFSVGALREVLDYYQLQLSIKDLPGENYYFLKLSAVGKEKVGADSINVVKPLTFESSDKILLSSLRNWIQPGTFALFDDEFLFDSMSTFRIQVPSDSLFTSSFMPEAIDIQISTISTPMYTFYINLLENNRIYGGPLSNIKADYGNVDQGLGIFGFKNTKSIRIFMK
jgi:hypothetical protein